MANPEHLKILKSGAAEWNKWRRENDVRPDLSYADLRKADLRKADLRKADLRKADLRYADLRYADLSYAVLSGANLSDAVLSGADLSDAVLSGTDLSDAVLRSAVLRYAVLSDADLSDAVLRSADLSDAVLNDAVLSYAVLTGAVLSYADLSGAVLSDAVLTGADLRYAVLSDTDLSGADLSDADLSGAVLSDADLSDAVLSNAVLSDADLSYATFHSSNLGFLDLKSCKNLDLTRHNGPSSIDMHSTQLDFDNFPEKFLAGCGLNKWQIEAWKLNNPKLRPSEVTDLVYRIDQLRNAAPIQMNNLFISYSRADSGFVERLEKVFKKRDVRYWRDVHDMVAGPVEKQIDRAIRYNETVLLVLTENSVESDWVEYEIGKARELEKQLRRPVICPVALDDSWKEAPWPKVLMNQVKKYNILDFSDWQNGAAFNTEFEKLLKGLNIFYRK